jgi:hypothetical protein
LDSGSKKNGQLNNCWSIYVNWTLKMPVQVPLFFYDFDAKKYAPTSDS